MSQSLTCKKKSPRAQATCLASFGLILILIVVAIQPSKTLCGIMWFTTCINNKTYNSIKKHEKKLRTKSLNYFLVVAVASSPAPISLLSALVINLSTPNHPIAATYPLSSSLFAVVVTCGVDGKDSGGLK